MRTEALALNRQEYRDALKRMINFDGWANPFAMNLTFRQVRRPEPYSRLALTQDYARENVRFFLRLLNRKLLPRREFNAGRRVGSIVVMEQSGDRRLHCHGIVECPNGEKLDELPTLVRDIWRSTDWGYEQTLVTTCDEVWLDYITKLKGKAEYDAAFEFTLWQPPLSMSRSA